MDNQTTADATIDDPNITVDSGEAEDTGSDQSGNWYDSLDATYKAHPSVTKFKSPNDLAKSYIELQKVIGKDKVVVPTDKSTPEEWAAFYAKVGAPDSVDGYETPIVDVPDEVKLKDEQLSAFKAKAKELGLNKKQFAELAKFQQEMSATGFSQQVEQAKKIQQNTETDLRREFGAAYESKIDLAQKMINSFSKGKEMHPAWKVLQNDKGFVKMMVDIASNLGEDYATASEAAPLTPNDAQNEINKMLGDFSGPYFNDMHPEHKAAVTRMVDLQRMLAAGNR